MMPDGLRDIGEILRIEAKPGDRFVLSTDQCLSSETVGRIQKVWAEFAPELGPILILDSGMRLSVVSKDDR